ncbi:MAG: NINE protein, partial [Saprospiraceae bacterium]|nr:NINE protein [Saprospiraceae bacterium]
MTSKRQLAAIMFTDIAGFSAMMHADEVYARQVLNRQRQVLENKHQDFGGKILQFVGDGTLSIFNSAVQAVECAVNIQVELRSDPYVPLRIGIHTGDITYDETGAFGDGVNITSRVEQLCIPGGVYITEKVYDDIKNHPWLTALSLGAFHLHNIESDVYLYAINSRSLPIPENPSLIVEPGRDNYEIPTGISKKKRVAAFLALFLGMFGAHRFYLGQRGKGIAYLAVFFVGFAGATEGEPLFMVILSILAFVDAVLLFVMPEAEFDQKYNKGLPKETVRARKQRKRSDSGSQKSDIDQSFNKALRFFERGKYKEAIQWFDKVLDLNENDRDTHYYLACCFSLLQEEENAFIHLGLAVKNGFRDFDRIEKDINLYYLKSRPAYSGFVANGYRMVEALPEPQPDLLQTDRFDPSVLDKIELLGDRLERGELSQEEFQLQKERILR